MAMAKNKSHAVMAQRVEPHDSLDDFPTPPWATRALCEYVISPKGTVWEPACNRGHMVKPLSEYFQAFMASDVHDYGCGYDVQDFLFPGPTMRQPADWIITNPPFRLAEEFALTAFSHVVHGCALFVRTAFLESVGRYERLFSTYPPAVIAQFAERVVLHKGRLTKDGGTATAYCWVVWEAGYLGGTEFTWIPPCRKQLERDSDYAEE